ncbi:MAG: response regulator [Leptospirales bacterium]
MSTEQTYDILVVDDDPNSIEIIEEFLSEEPYQITSLNNGKDAIALLQKHPKKFYCVILDRVMPELDGIEVVKKIKRVELLKEIPVIMQTGKDADHEVLEGYEAGAHYYMIKPINRNLLKGITKAALKDCLIHRELRGKAEKTEEIFTNLEHGKYYFKTLDDVNTLSVLVARVTPNPGLAAIGLYELMINAVEHGNLAITYEEKTSLETNQQLLDEINRKMSLPEFQEKNASIEIKQSKKNIEFIITDEGNGFDWENLKDFQAHHAFENHGRGISMAAAISFDSIKYKGKGNEVSAIIKL